MKFHPIADCFPLIEGEEFDVLVADIVANGLLNPIVVFEDKILDGRNRWRACQKAGVEASTTEYTGDNPVQFVISANASRRQMRPWQKALVAARFANLLQGSNQFHKLIQEHAVGPSGSGVLSNAHTEALKRVSHDGLSNEFAGKLLGVSASSVERAKVVLTRGTPDDIRQVEIGEISIEKAAALIRKKDKAVVLATKKPKPKTESQETALDRRRIIGSIWCDLRDAIEHIFNLPTPGDVAHAVKTCDRGGLANRRLSEAVRRLQEIEYAWNQQGNANRVNSGNGHVASGEERKEQAA